MPGGGKQQADKGPKAGHAAAAATTVAAVDAAAIPSPVAILLTDSFSDEMKPITRGRPRALVPVGNVPLLDYALELLVVNGIREVRVVAHTGADDIGQHLQSTVTYTGKPWVQSTEIKVMFIRGNSGVDSLQSALLDVLHMNQLPDHFLLLPVNVLTNARNLAATFQTHMRRHLQKRSMVFTVAVVEAATPLIDAHACAVQRAEEAAAANVDITSPTTATSASMADFGGTAAMLANPGPPLADTVVAATDQEYICVAVEPQNGNQLVGYQSWGESDAAVKRAGPDAAPKNATVKFVTNLRKADAAVRTDLVNTGILVISQSFVTEVLQQEAMVHTLDDCLRYFVDNPGYCTCTASVDFLSSDPRGHAPALDLQGQKKPGASLQPGWDTVSADDLFTAAGGTASSLVNDVSMTTMFGTPRPMGATMAPRRGSISAFSGGSPASPAFELHGTATLSPAALLRPSGGPAATLLATSPPPQPAAALWAPRPTYLNVFDRGDAPRQHCVAITVRSGASLVAASVAVSERRLFPFTRESNFAEAEPVYAVWRYMPSVYAHVAQQCRLGASMGLGPNVVLGEDCAVSASAHVAGSVLGNRCRIGNGVMLMHCVLLDDVEVADGTCLSNTVVGAGVKLLANGFTATNVMIGDGVTVAATGSGGNGPAPVWPQGTRVALPAKGAASDAALVGNGGVGARYRRPGGISSAASASTSEHHVPSSSTVGGAVGAWTNGVSPEARVNLLGLFVRDAVEAAAQKESDDEPEPHEELYDALRSDMDQAIQSTTALEGCFNGWKLDMIQLHLEVPDLACAITRGMITAVATRHRSDEKAARKAIKEVMKKWCDPVYRSLSRGRKGADRESDMFGMLRGICLALADDACDVLRPPKTAARILSAFYAEADPDRFEEKGYAIVSVDAILKFDDGVEENPERLADAYDASEIETGWAYLKGYVEDLREAEEEEDDEEEEG